MTAATAPQREIGYAQNTAHGGYWWTLEDETTPELVWPNSVVVYDSMRRTDSQVASVLRAVTLPVRRTPWRIDPNGARDEVVEHVATDLGLPIVGAEAPKAPPRMRDRFSWPEHLRQALLMLPYGHSYFEMTYRVDKDGNRAHLHKLAPRPAKTIERIEVARDGGLVWIKQYPSGPGGSGDSQKPIPVSSLVAYIHDREGGNWLGTSVLRPAYKNWLLKDRLLRVQAQTIERNGMGIPLYKAQENASEADITAGRDMATAWRAGEAAGSAIPFGADLVLRGVEGTLPDAEKVVRYHDEQIARAVLAHFLNLGTQTGSWALGTTFADFFTLSLQTLAQQIADTATMHVIEDLVDANWGEDEPAPRLVFDEIGSRQAATAAAIKSLIDAGAIQLDGTLEEMLRQQYGLPPRDPEAAQEDEAAIDADAMVAAIDAFRGGGAQPVTAAAGPNFNRLHPRGAKGRFRDTFSRILDGLTKWAAAGGEGDPFDGFEREPLRRVAVARGITLRRGASRDDVADALLGHLREALAGKPDDEDDDEPEAKPPAKKAVKKAAPRKRTPAKPDPEPRMSDAEVQQIINSTLTDEGKRRILTSNGVPQSEWPEALRPQPVKAAPKPTAAEKLAAGYPDVPPGVDVDEDEWAAMSYSERVDAIVSARLDPEQSARDRQAKPGDDLPSGADIEVETKRGALSNEDLVQGRHLTPAGRRALDALGPAGHPRIAAIPDAEGKIREAYRMLAISGGRDHWVGFEDLRKLLGEQVPRTEVDDTLRRMARMSDVSLSPQHYGRHNSATRIPAAVRFGGQDNDQIHIDDPATFRTSDAGAVELAEELDARRTGDDRDPRMSLLSDEDLRAAIADRAARDPIVARDLKAMGYNPEAPDPEQQARDRQSDTPDDTQPGEGPVDYKRRKKVEALTAGVETATSRAGALEHLKGHKDSDLRLLAREYGVGIRIPVPGDRKSRTPTPSTTRAATHDELAELVLQAFVFDGYDQRWKDNAAKGPDLEQSARDRQADTPAPNSDGKDGSTVVSSEMLTASGSGATMDRDEQAENQTQSAREIAGRWDGHQADKDALMRADRQQWFDETASKMSPGERNEAYIRGQLRSSTSGVGAVTVAAAAAVADRLGVAYDLGDHRTAQVDYMRQRPELDRAVRSLGEAYYAVAQTWFADRGITSVDLHRKAGLHDDRAVITSWAARESGTFNAPEHEGGRTLRHEATPVERIFSHVGAGLGALEEEEFLVFNESSTPGAPAGPSAEKTSAQSGPDIEAIAANIDAAMDRETAEPLLAKLTKPQLRAVAKAAGITIRNGSAATSADIRQDIFAAIGLRAMFAGVRGDVDNAFGAAMGMSGPDREQQARDRQSDIDSARRYADVAAIFDETLANLVDDDHTELDANDHQSLLLQIDQRTARHPGVEGEIAPIRDAIAAGDIEGARRLMADLLARRGIRQEWSAGDRIPLDRTRHQPITPGQGFRDGAQVEVIRPGYTLDRPADPVRAREIEVENRIRAAYRRLTEGRTDESSPGRGPWIGLVDLRREIGSDLSREEQDEALNRMNRGGSHAVAQSGMRLIPVANAKALTDADREAALPGRGRDRLSTITFADPSDRPVSGESIRLSKATVEAAPAAFKVGFTGTRQGMTPVQRRQLRERLQALKEQHGTVEFHYGQAIGADEEAAEIAHSLGFRVVSHPPSKTDQMSARGDLNHESRPPKDFLDRNHDIVDESDVLLATPQTRTERQRSGTWATIRYARKGGTDVEEIHGDEPADAPDDAPSVDPLSDLRSLPDPEAIRDALDLRKIDGPDGLKSLLKSAGLPVSGRKRDLVDRLVEHLGGAPAAGGGSAEPATGNDALTMTAVPLRNESERAAFRDWAGGYVGVNAALRSGTDGAPRDRRITAGLDSALARSALPRDIVVTRGTDDLGPLGSDTPAVGAEWTDLGFNSTAALRPQGITGIRPGGAQMTIRVPAGTHAVSGPGLDPDEILLDRGLTYRITRADLGADGVWRLDVEVVPSTPEAPRKRTPAKKAVRAAVLDDDGREEFDDFEIDPDVQAEIIARLGVDLDEEDDDEEDRILAAAFDRERLHHYWTRGKGLAKWIGSPHPWTTLYGLLRKHVGAERAKRMAAEWVHEVTGLWPGSDAHRVAHGGKMRGDVIGPG